MAPVGTLSPSDLESGGPVWPVGRLSPFDHVGRLSPFAPPVGEMSSVDPARGPPGGGGGIAVIWTEFTDREDPVITQLPADGPVRITGILWIWTLRWTFVRLLRS